MKATIESLFKNKEFMAEFERVAECEVKNLSSFKTKKLGDYKKVTV